MKRFKIFLLTILIVFFNSFSVLKVEADGSFAKVLNSTNIYKNISTSNDIQNIICLAEKSYYVEIIDKNFDDFFRVKYNGIVGYVKKSDVKEIIGSPYTPYPYNIKLTIKNTCNLRTLPTNKTNVNNIICTLYPDESNFIFIGRVFGDEVIDFSGNTWYYVIYNGNKGYVYNQYVKSITPIYENTEPYQFKVADKIENINPISHTPSLIIIIILFLPCIALLLILFLPYKAKKQKKLRSPKIFDRY